MEYWKSNDFPTGSHTEVSILINQRFAFRCVVTLMNRGTWFEYES